MILARVIGQAVSTVKRPQVVVEGRAAADIVGRKLAPVDAAIIGIVDQVDIEA